MKLSVITPSIRPESLVMVAKCLSKQTFPKEDMEWIVCMPKDKRKELEKYISDIFPYKFIEEPDKRDGDFYNLCKAYNACFKESTGDLLISWQDGIWADRYTLQYFWDLYESNPKSCTGALGDQYSSIDAYGKPDVLFWTDPRRTDKYGDYYEIFPNDLEFTLCSVPRRAVFEVGGMDEIGDQFAAIFEKEMCARIDMLGYKFYIDQTLNYRAVHHDRISGKEEWDKRYFAGCVVYEKNLKDIANGVRLKLNYL